MTFELLPLAWKQMVLSHPTCPPTHLSTVETLQLALLNQHFSLFLPLQSEYIRILYFYSCRLFNQ